MKKPTQPRALLTMLDRYHQNVQAHEALGHDAVPGLWYCWCRTCGWWARLWLAEGNPFWVHQRGEESGTDGRWGYESWADGVKVYGLDGTLAPFPEWIIELGRIGRRGGAKKKLGA